MWLMVTGQITWEEGDKYRPEMLALEPRRVTVSRIILKFRTQEIAFEELALRKPLMGRRLDGNLGKIST
jgi:hypothetical protein